MTTTNNTFGVSQQSVAAVHFPMWPAFSASSKPTAVTVALLITESASHIASRLYGENITASDIVDSESVEFLLCAEQLRRMVALKVLKASTQQMPELAKDLTTEIAEWFTGLAAGGATFLGNSALATGDADPDGPMTHINTYGLTIDDSADMSTTVPRLRRDDAL